MLYGLAQGTVWTWPPFRLFLWPYSAGMSRSFEEQHLVLTEPSSAGPLCCVQIMSIQTFRLRRSLIGEHREHLRGRLPDIRKTLGQELRVAIP